MPTWGEILNELKQLEEQGVRPPFDIVRRRYLASLYKYTKRNTIIYASQWTQPGNLDPNLISITEEDIQGIMEVISTKIAATLADHQKFKSHARHINRQMAKEIGLIINDLEDDQKFQDLVLSVFHSTTHTFSGTSAVKIVENHLGKAFIKQQRMVLIQQPPQASPQPQKEQK